MGESLSNSVRSSAKNVKEVFGRRYTFQLYIDLECEGAAGQPEQITVDAGKLTEADPWTCFGDNEHIKNIYLFKNKLFFWQRTQRFLFHSFVVFQTRNYWWSIEKNGEGVTIQRSLSKAKVRDYYRCELRTGFDGVKSPDHVVKDCTKAGKSQLRDIMAFMKDANLVSSRYNIVSANCQSFAYHLFNHFAKEKAWIRGKA